MDAHWHRVAASGDVQGKEPVACQAAGIALALVRLGEEVFAVEDRCPHMAYPLTQGVARDGRLICTWHHWEFDLPDQQRFLQPHCRCTIYPVRENDGAVYVQVDPENLPPPPGGFPRPDLTKSND